MEPLIGSWSLIVENIRPDGSVQVTDAEWHFSWALGGRAVVDVWISPSRHNAPPAGPEEWGMSVRFYDESIERIRSTWHGPHRGWVIPFLARATGDEITLDGEHDGLDVRWTFSGITQHSFKWRAAERPPGGEWRVRQQFAATRVAAGS
ncbi:MAG TPA: hypothetical protein VGC98_00465 [Thermoleophilaceae bacterium]